MKHLQKKTTVDHAKQTDAIHEAANRVTQAIAAVPGLITLTAAERKRTNKMHTGAERYVRAMADLAQSEERLCPAGVDPAAMKTQIDGADELAVLHSTLAAALRAVEDTILFRQGHAYSDALDVYALVRTHARREPALHASIATFEAFLATGPQAAKKGARSTGSNGSGT